jgi:hypothetical protein
VRFDQGGSTEGKRSTRTRVASGYRPAQAGFAVKLGMNDEG